MAENAGEEASPDDQSNAASDADQDHDQTDGTEQKDQEATADTAEKINLDQEAIGDETKETENSKPEQIENTKTEQIDGNVKPLFEIPGPIPLLRDLYSFKNTGTIRGITACTKKAKEYVTSAPESESGSDFYAKEEKGFEFSRVEVQRVKKSDENVILGSDKEEISAPESESGSYLYTKGGKGSQVSVEESRRVKKGDQNVIPGSDTEVISGPESESSRSDFCTKEEKGCQVSLRDENVSPASDEEVISTPKESQSTGSQQTKNPCNFSWQISDPFSDVDPRLYQKYFEEIPDVSSYFRW
ncbi:hypothetical protein D8674_011361 [Pyrus ussuriensis x Pyrus communis]|uniref:Uncharacterized protein n=1 Tax=Pyrus ussuriensis x Pyrus communis TaxID=2448454 RepID=A0A5N5FYL0_9ROSA|nr:hypothetical protein D8674_011361 [Pyrus ussuriensis x Pyrus communis]